MPKIVLSNIAKQFAKDRYAVKDLDLELADGSFTAILGPSGCGKTTTLRMIAGLESPTAGSISVGDTVFSSTTSGVFVPPHQRRLGLVFQNYALWPHLNVRKNVEFGLTIAKMPRDERQKRVDEMLDLLRVGHLGNRLPAQLSGGEQQRVAIARALAPRPSLVLFDEPLSNLDAPLRLELSTELKRLHTELGMTALLVTHDQAEAMAVATVLVVMRDGAIEQMAPPTEVYRAPASVHVAKFIGNPPMNLVSSVATFGQLGDLAAAGKGVTPGVVASLGIRPEHVLLGVNREGWTVPGRVVSVLATGPAAIVQVQLDGASMLTALVSGETDLAAGRDTDVTIELDRVHLFDATDRRIGLSDSDDLLASVKTSARTMTDTAIA